MPQKIKIISLSRFIYSKAIMPKTPAKRKKETGKLTDEVESRKVRLTRSAKLAKSTEVPLVVTPEAALYTRASKNPCLWTGPHVSTCKQNIHIANILLHLHT
jgi:hypothetical protein